MGLSINEKIRVLLKRKNMTLTTLADITGQSRQNLSNKLSRNNFTEKEITRIATALDTKFICCFRSPDGTEV